jgi:hypothetical protein
MPPVTGRVLLDLGNPIQYGPLEVELHHAAYGLAKPELRLTGK